jgi:hypothetical protein
MTTKAQKIAELKLKHPTISKGVNDEILLLDANEYKDTIEKWAEVELTQEAELAQAEANIQAKAELLKRLGITQAEANLLLK